MSNRGFINQTLRAALPLAVLTALGTSQVQAQGEGSPSARSTLEEIVVTARRTQESLQSVPVTVTAFGDIDIRRKGISSLEDIQLATPGVHLSGSSSRSNPVYQIRGQSKSLNGTMAPAVVTYFGEVPEPNFGSFVPQYDLENIQVLKGPQGTLFGRNTTGGAVLYTPAAPSHELTGHITAGLGNDDLRKVEGAVNLPLIADKLAVRFAGVSEERDGYTKDLGFNTHQDDEDFRAYRVSVMWTPTENISNTFIYDHMKRNTNSSATVAVDYLPGGVLPGAYGFDASLRQAVAEQRARGPRTVVNTREPYDDMEKLFINNRTEIEFGGLTLVNIFGYRDVELDFLINADGLPVLTTDGSGAFPPGFRLELIKSALRQDLEQYSNELQLMGQFFDDKLDWRIGASWLKSEPTGPQGTWVAFATAEGGVGRNTAYNFSTETSKAVFAHGSYDLGNLVDGLELELGVRYTRDEIEACTGIGLDGERDVGLSACEKADLSQITDASTNVAKSSKTTWSAGLNWQVNEDLFAYVVSRHGYRAGSINGPTFSGRLTQYQAVEPETVTDFEIGFRSDWAIGSVDMRTNISAFIAKYEDVQAPISGVTTSPNCAAFEAENPGVPVPPGLSPDGTCTPQDDPSGNTLMVNMGETEVSGMDAELTIMPVENLTLHFGASYLDTETKKINRPDALAPYMASLTGVRFEYVARKTATAAVNYELPVGSSVLESMNFHANYYWTDDISYAGAWMIPGYSVTNVRVDFIGLGTPGLELGLWVRNAFDKDYVAAGAVAGSAYGMNAGLLGPPRMYGAELRYNF